MADNDEKLFINGRIYTIDGERSWKEALIVRCERIWKTGTSAEMRRLAAPDAEVIDLGGRFAMPGFIDAHTHFAQGGQRSLEVELKDCNDEMEFEKRVAGYAQQFKSGEWMTGGGWDHERWPDKKLPTAALLDRAVPKNPVWLTRLDGHIGFANSLALKLAGIDRNTKSPSGGEIGHDAAGEPDGTLRDNAMNLIDIVIPPPTRLQVEKAIHAALDKAGQYGVTTVLEMETTPDSLAIYTELEKQAMLTTRVYACPDASSLEKMSGLGITTGFGSDMLRIEGAKLYVDGSMGAGTALFFEPYHDRPNTSGLAVMSETDLDSRIRQVDEAGLQLQIHAIGDKAVWMALDDISRLPSRDRRAKLEHVQVIRRQDFELFKKTGTIASVQPCHLLDDMHWCEKRVAQRCKDGYVYESLLKAGIPQAFGTDWPVESLNPWFGIYAAVTRMDLDGQPEGGWFPEEKMPLADALHEYTMGSAYACFMEKHLGSIEPGKLADLIITVESPFDIAPKALKDVKNWMTVVNGKVVWKKH